MLFLGSKKEHFREVIWEAWAPGKLKIFAWLLHQDRLWCNDRLQRRGWENNYFCQFCLRNLECSEHLFWRCNFSRSVWNKMALWHGCSSLSHNTWLEGTNSMEIMTAIIGATQPWHKKGIKSIALLTLWELWQERNRCVFRAKIANEGDVNEAIKRAFTLWRQAGVKCIQSPFGDPP